MSKLLGAARFVNFPCVGNGRGGAGARVRSITQEISACTSTTTSDNIFAPSYGGKHCIFDVWRGRHCAWSRLRQKRRGGGAFRSSSSKHARIVFHFARSPSVCGARCTDGSEAGNRIGGFGPGLRGRWSNAYPVSLLGDAFHLRFAVCSGQKPITRQAPTMDCIGVRDLAASVTRTAVMQAMEP